MNAEQERLAENREAKRWHLWGPYLSERREFSIADLRFLIANRLR